ncbi:MAG: M20/M25/M40 family metallo-hydrolase [Frankia sp.]
MPVSSARGPDSDLCADPPGRLQAAPAGEGGASDASQTEAATILSTLIAFDSSNPGRSERPIAEWIAAKLGEAGLRPEVFESRPGRASVVARISGRDRSRPALLVHGHLDVVPADPSEWSTHPFSGEISAGCVWGRGAVDMKDMLAMLLAVVADWQRRGCRPDRDIVLAFTADEEAGGSLGAGFLVDEHPDLFAGCTEAVGEVGGFSVTTDRGKRIYPIQNSEKGALWMRLATRGTAGHGSLLNKDNAVTRMSSVLARLGSHPFPTVIDQDTRTLLRTVGQLSDTEIDGAALAREMESLRSFGRMLGATLQNTVTPTSFRAGNKVNTVPSMAEATVDARFLPGQRDILLEVVDGILGTDVTREMLLEHDSVSTPFEGATVQAMTAALLAEDPAAYPVPFMLSGGTDAKAFSRLGIRCFGFSPLLLPPDHDFVSMFHGVNERVPVDSLAFGVRVLDRFLRLC